MKSKFSTFSTISAKFRQNFIKIWAKFKQKNPKITKFCKILLKNAKSLTKIFWNIEVWAVQKHVNLVDLVKSFPTNIFLQNLASIQKRTSPVKFAHLAEKSEKRSISNLSTKLSTGCSSLFGNVQESSLWAFEALTFCLQATTNPQGILIDSQ